MKITKTNLRKMIKEELSAVMSEDYFSQSVAAKKLADELAGMSDEDLKNRISTLAAEREEARSWSSRGGPHRDIGFNAKPYNDEIAAIQAVQKKRAKARPT